MTKSFKKNVEVFWQEFIKQEKSLREMVEKREQPERVVKTLNKLFSICFEETYFQIGYSNALEKFELIVTPEGNKMWLPALFYWYTKTPKEVFSNWRVHYTKPAQLVDDDVNLQMYDTVLDNDMLSFYVTPDKTGQKFHIKVYCENLNQLEEAKAYNMLFIYLDNLIGELFVMQHIGAIDFLDENKSDEGVTVEAKELKEFMETLMREEKWETFENPLKVYSGYQMQPNEDPNCGLREDIFIGYTRMVPLINDFLDGDEKEVLRAKKDGVHFGYLFFNNHFLPRDQVVDFRGKVEDRLLEVLEDKDIATLLGGATGYLNSYIDLVIFDWELFLEETRKVAKEFEISFSYSDFYKEAMVIELETNESYS